MSGEHTEYCEYCNTQVGVSRSTVCESLMVRGEPFEVNQEVVLCNECGNRLGIEAIENENLRRAYNRYRQVHSFLTPEEIRNIYTGYELSQASFGKLLGLGATTISRYEQGGLQTKQIDAALRSAEDPAYMLTLLEEKKDDIPNTQYQKAVSVARGRIKSDTDGMTITPIKRGNFDVLPGVRMHPSEKNGYRSLNIERVREMAINFAAECKDFYLVRFNKAFFYADMKSYEFTSKSMTGLLYSNAPQGPIIDGYDILKGMLADGKNLTVEVRYFGDIEAEEIVPLREPDLSLFTEDEIAIMSSTISFLNGFKTSRQLSDYTHDEIAWKETVPGQTIDYSYAFSLKESTIDQSF